MLEDRVVDGVDTKGWFDTIDAVTAKPELGKFKFRARNKWVKGTHCHTTIKDFYGLEREIVRPKSFELDADEPEVLLGHDNGPNATEALLYALSSCLTAAFIYQAAARKITVDELELDLEGEIDLRGVLQISDQVRNGFQIIRVTFRVKANATEEQIRELCELAQKTSPVYDIVTHPTPVQASVEIM